MSLIILVGIVLGLCILGIILNLIDFISSIIYDKEIKLEKIAHIVFYAILIYYNIEVYKSTL